MRRWVIRCALTTAAAIVPLSNTSLMACCCARYPTHFFSFLSFLLFFCFISFSSVLFLLLFRMFFFFLYLLYVLFSFLFLFFACFLLVFCCFLFVCFLGGGLFCFIVFFYCSRFLAYHYYMYFQLIHFTSRWWTPYCRGTPSSYSMRRTNAPSTQVCSSPPLYYLLCRFFCLFGLLCFFLFFFSSLHCLNCKLPASSFFSFYFFNFF